MTLISIICGAYNVEKTLEKSIESIINQSYQNWELIICDDGSTDSTWIILEKYKSLLGKKCKIIKNDINKGLNITLNRCLKISTGEYIARHDLDDYSHPTRLEEQINFLEVNSEFCMVGTGMQREDETGIWGHSIPPQNPDKNSFIKGSPFCHATMLINRSVMIELGGYSESLNTLRVEDYDLWFRIYEVGFKGHNLQKSLYTMLDDRNAYNRRKYKYRVNEFKVKLKGFYKLKINLIYTPWTFKPLIVGLIPFKVYNAIRRKYIK